MLDFEVLEDALKVLNEADIVAQSGHFGTNVADVAKVVGSLLSVVTLIVQEIHDTHPDNPVTDQEHSKNG